MDTLKLINEYEDTIKNAYKDEPLSVWNNAVREFAFCCIGMLTAELDFNEAYTDTREERFRKILKKCADDIINRLTK